MKRLYLVTGAAGHLGNTIANKLVKLKKNVRVLLLEKEKDVLYLPPKVERIIGNICEKKSLENLFENNKNNELIVIHCAGIVTIKSKYDPLVYDVNVNGTKNVIDMCIKHKVKKLIYVSSVHAIPEKQKGKLITEIDQFNKDEVIGLYAQTKAEATQIALNAGKKGLDVSVVHPSGIIGPYDYGNGHLTQLIIDYANKKLTSIVKGGYDFVDVRDVSDGIISCVDNGKRNECYILSNKYYSVSEIMNELSALTGGKKIKSVLAIWFVKIVAPLAELYYKIKKQTPLFTSYSMYTLNSNSYFSHEKADKILNYKTTDIKDTLKDTIVWLTEKGRI